MHRIVPYLRPGLAIVLAACFVVAGHMVLPAAAEPGTARNVTIEHFMTGLACVESSGRYDAVNPTSGAYGKYQIMPRNWPVWAGRFLGDTKAKPTPENQELVARSRIERLYASRESWRRVAYWWLTGRSQKNEAKWTDKAVGYVDSVMRYARMAANPERADRVPKRCLPKSFDGLGTNGGEAATDRVVVTGRSIYVRRGPGAEHRLFAVVRRGDVLQVLDTADDPRGKSWLEIELSGGRSGWIAGWYTRPKANG